MRRAMALLGGAVGLMIGLAICFATGTRSSDPAVLKTTLIILMNLVVYVYLFVKENE